MGRANRGWLVGLWLGIVTNAWAGQTFVVEEAPNATSAKVRANTQKAKRYRQETTNENTDVNLLDLFSGSDLTPREENLGSNRERARDYVPDSNNPSREIILLPTTDNTRSNNQQQLDSNRARAQGYLNTNDIPRPPSSNRNCVPSSTLVIGIEGIGGGKNLVTVNKGGQTTDTQCRSSSP